VTLQLRTVNFGRNRANATGSVGVGYFLQDTNGNVATQRTTDNVYQSLPNSGIYYANIDFPDAFRGAVVWDCGTTFQTTSYAIEEYNVEANDPRVLQTLQSLTGSIQTLIDVSVGWWKIQNNQMIFFSTNDDTPIATFNLFDDQGTPSSENVFERRRV